MKAFLKALAKEGVLSIVILVLLCVLVWFGGMLFVDEDNDLVKIRIIIIVVLLSIWVVLFIVQKVLAIRNAQKIEAQLKAQAGAHLDGASADQKDIIDEMRQKFDDSLSALKKTKGGKSALFTLPWYVIIGPPGSGKTTALQESGLNFPASDAGAKVKGIGGTRNCDWWFTEDGILLDTAGRYTTVADDNKEWTEFLDMIRIGRKTKPINGVIVAMSLDDVLRGTQAEIDQMARDIGNRVAELSAHLHAVFPVYVLFTKADLVKGFVEFYEDFTREERNQVWGWTFPFGPPDKQYITIFDERMAELNERIEARRMKLLSTERPDRKKESIYLFPSQMRLAQKKMREFMGSLFSANTFQESTVLRGVYLTSGTQDGTPIDQILARMNKVLGVDPAPIDESRIEKKSFFIHNLFKKIIFKDKVLARSSSKLVRKRKSVRLAVQGVSVAALALLLWVSVWSFITNKGHINDVEAASASLKDAKDREKLEALDELRLTLEPLLEHETEGVPLDERWGMYQGERMLNAGVEPYLAELNTSFVNDTKELIEKELILSVNRTVGGSEKDSNRQGFFEMLDLWRAYRMMCGQMDVQADLIVTELQGKYWNAGKGKQDSGLANKQLAFYASLISYSKVEEVDIGVFLEPNTGVEKAANKAIEAGSWRNDVYFNYVRKAYRNLEGSRYQKLDPSLPKRLTYQPDMTSRLLPYLRVFTQDGWDNYLQEYLEDALATMRDLFKNLNRTWDEPKMYKSLHEYHAKMIDEAWDEYLACVHLEENKFDNIDRCDGSLRPSGNRRRLGDECSELVKSVEELRTVKWEAADVPYSTPARNIDSSYLEGATAGLDDFTKALVDYAKATKKNRRFRDLDDPEDKDGASAKLDVFLEAAGGAFEKSSYDGTGSEAAVAKFYTNLMRDFGKVVASDAYEELKDRWKEEVLSQYNLGVKGKFPFNQDIPDEKVVTLGKDITRIIEEVNKYKDADMAIVSSLFNGVDGIVKRNFALQDMLAGKKLAGVDLFTDPGTKAVFDQELADLRKAIFHKVKNKDSKTVNVEFKVRIVHEKPATGMTFTVGVGKDLKPRVVRHNPFQTGVFGTTVYWFYPEQDGEKVKSQLGARIYIENSKRGSGQDPGTRGETGRQWELLRLFWFGSNVHRRKVKMKIRDDGKDRIIEGLDIYEYYLPTNKNPLMCSIWVWPFTAEEGEPFDVDTYKDLGTIDIFNERGDK